MTLTEFLENSGATLRFYDLGRRVTPVTREDFLAFERAEHPWPTPLQQKAWFALVLTPGDNREPLIWFLCFDLDEQGLLVQATRDYLLGRFAEIASERPDPQTLGEALRENPLAFAPREDKMANLHAQVHQALGLPPSQYHTHAYDYLSGQLGWDQWSFVGFQGLADIAARQHQDDDGLLARAIPHLPPEPLIALCQCLEHHVPGPRLEQALHTRLRLALDAPSTSPALFAALLRGLSRGAREPLRMVIREVLARPQSSDPEVLAAIGGRAWEALGDPDTARAWLERLADEAVPNGVFGHCVGDLLRLPGMRPPLLSVLRSPDTSEQLKKAFGALG